MVKKRKELRKTFNAKPETWRIESVIHDGNWYDKPKWMRVAKVSEETLDEWIEDNKDNLIKSELDSYRMGYDDILAWYRDEDLDLEKSIVPNNFPPKLWGDTTETEVFLSAPRRRVGTVNFKAESPEILEKVTNILKGVAKISPDGPERHRAYGLSAVHMRSLLSKGLSEEEFESLDVKARAILMLRELVDLPDEWLEDALDFYANTFAPSILRSSMSTIEIYLPDRHDIHSQTVIWVINAMQKFNESASVPFSGYLSSVLRYWPYDLPDEALGKDLAKFQRDRKRAIDKLNKEENRDNIPIDELAETMDMPLKEYIEFNSQHENWLSERNATTLTWEDSANEKRGELLGVDTSPRKDSEKLHNISMAAINSAIITKDWGSAFSLIEQVDKGFIDEDIRENLSIGYVTELAKLLRVDSDEY